ncbi:MAG: hypothetical protein LW854_06725 [Rubrivivax sp.]|nr:hypothetical protein [Rubrivivax sp.]
MDTHPPPTGVAAMAQPDQTLAAELQRCRDLLNAGRSQDGEAAARLLAEAASHQGSHDTAAHAALLLARLMANSSRAGAAIEWARTSLQWAERAGARNLQARPGWCWPGPAPRAISRWWRWTRPLNRHWHAQTT